MGKATLFYAFELPTDQKPEEIISTFSQLHSVRSNNPLKIHRTYFDTIDNRLYKRNCILFKDESTQTILVKMLRFDQNQVLFAANLVQLPLYAHEMSHCGHLQQLLSPIIGIRSLLPITDFNVTTIETDLLDKAQKTVVKLTLESYQYAKSSSQSNVLPNRLLVQSIRGYDKESQDCLQWLSKNYQLKRKKEKVFLSLLGNNFFDSKRPTAKSLPILADQIPTHSACNAIFRHLLGIIETNHQGTIQNIDSEFLHEFRIAIRMTRSLLGELKGVYAKDMIGASRDSFSWFSQITSATRDLDVYLLEFNQDKKKLFKNEIIELEEFQQFLIEKQQKAHKKLAEQLKSSRFKSSINHWQKFLDQPLKPAYVKAKANDPVLQYASDRIWRVYRQVVKEGRQITADSPAEAVHEIRKDCKKLRYLIECFQSLYPKNKVKQIIKALKGIQDVLGTFQDYEVKMAFIEQFAQSQRKAANDPSLEAVVKLAEAMSVLKQQVKKDFLLYFTDFTSPRNRTLFTQLFSVKDKVN